MNTVGILSPGDMGHTVGQRLREHGLRVIAYLSDRSERTRQLAAKAGIEEVSSYEALVKEADIVLSILVPAQAGAAAQAVAEALNKTGAELLFADCNAIAPQTTCRIGKVVEDAGGRFVDASIIGPPPRREGTTRFYASGTHAEQLARLNEYGLDVPVVSARIGDASAVKMCYAGLTKGLTALCTELLVAAEALGVRRALLEEYRTSQAAMLQRMEGGLPGMPPKSRRWVGEMEEIAATMDSVGLTPKFHEAAADMYRFVGGSSLADRTPEDPEEPTLEEMLQVLVDNL
ncbi:MAG: DUF1932 domain-containing protein [Caldilineaceae bacterium]|nr:DUF1932 domain-containing protein [Caldilineaceae bacterium]MDE0179733.1 DUF1932 domain-containing protein [Caldilineaceae bacterium]